jgi:hypothetical protein
VSLSQFDLGSFLVGLVIATIGLSLLVFSHRIRVWTVEHADDWWTTWPFRRIGWWSELPNSRTKSYVPPDSRFDRCWGY